MPLTEHQTQKVSITLDCITAVQLFQKVRRLYGPSSANLFASLFSHAVKTAHHFFLEHIQSKATGDFKKLKERFKSDIFEREQTRAIFAMNDKMQQLLSKNRDVKKKVGKKIFEIEKKIFTVCDHLNEEIGIVEKKRKNKGRLSFSIFGRLIKKCGRQDEENEPIGLYLEELNQLDKEGGVIHGKKFRKQTGNFPDFSRKNIETNFKLFKKTKKFKF